MLGAFKRSSGPERAPGTGPAFSGSRKRATHLQQYVIGQLVDVHHLRGRLRLVRRGAPLRRRAAAVGEPPLRAAARTLHGCSCEESRQPLVPLRVSERNVQGATGPYCGWAAAQTSVDRRREVKEAITRVDRACAPWMSPPPPAAEGAGAGSSMGVALPLVQTRALSAQATHSAIGGSPALCGSPQALPLHLLPGPLSTPHRAAASVCRMPASLACAPTRGCAAPSRSATFRPAQRPLRAGARGLHSKHKDASVLLPARIVG